MPNEHFTCLRRTCEALRNTETFSKAESSREAARLARCSPDGLVKQKPVDFTGFWQMGEVVVLRNIRSAGTVSRIARVLWSYATVLAPSIEPRSIAGTFFSSYGRVAILARTVFVS